MVVGRKSDVKDLPEPGDVVEVLLGLDRVRATVVQSYFSGAQPQVLLALAPSQSGGETATVTLPTSTIEPVETTHSSWAEHQRYEQRCAEAIERLVDDAKITRQASSHDSSIDFVITSEQTVIFVEAKYSTRPLRLHALQSAVTKLRQAVSQEGRAALLITNATLPERLRVAPQVRVVQWRDEKDDRALKSAVTEALHTSV